MIYKNLSDKKMWILMLAFISFSQLSIKAIAKSIDDEKTPKKAQKINVLFIAVDDLKPWVSAYGENSRNGQVGKRRYRFQK